MLEKIGALHKRIGIEPYWYLIGAWLLWFAGLFINHLVTGATPGRVFISPFGFDIFWYGIVIMGGIALGSYVVSRLVAERAMSMFTAQVSQTVRDRRLSELKFPQEVRRHLAKRRFRTAGDLLLQWGFDPRTLGLTEDGLEVVGERLAATPGVDEGWLKDAPWRPWNPELVWNGIIIALILGVIGARLYHVLTPSPSMAAFGIESPLDYFRNPGQLINVRNGGLGIFGGIAGGILGLLIFARYYRLPTIAWADLSAVGFALGQVFGRWGNFFNQELYGSPTELPWGITIDQSLFGYPVETRFHPAFLYESVWSLLTFLVLLRLARRHGDRLLTGDLSALFLIFYSFGRILLEFVRLDSRMVTLGGTETNIAVATLVSIVVIVLMLLWRGIARTRARA